MGLYIGMGGGGCRILLTTRGCFQQLAQLAHDGEVSYEEEVGHTQARKQGSSRMLPAMGLLGRDN